MSMNGVLDSVWNATVDRIVFLMHRRPLKQEEPDHADLPGVEVTITDIHILNQRIYRCQEDHES